MDLEKVKRKNTFRSFLWFHVKKSIMAVGFIVQRLIVMPQRNHAFFGNPIVTENNGVDTFDTLQSHSLPLWEKKRKQQTSCYSFLKGLAI